MLPLHCVTETEKLGYNFFCSSYVVQRALFVASKRLVFCEYFSTDNATHRNKYKYPYVPFIVTACV